MSKKANKPPADKRGGQPVQFNRRFYWIRAVLVTALVFIFILWSRRASLDTTAYLWASGLAAATLLYFIVSYYMLRR
jgi:hypothetical protein